MDTFRCKDRGVSEEYTYGTGVNLYRTALSIHTSFISEKNYTLLQVPKLTDMSFLNITVCTQQNCSISVIQTYDPLLTVPAPAER